MAKKSKTATKRSQAKIQTMQRLRAQGKTLAQIAKRFKISTSKVCILLRRAESPEVEAKIVTAEMKQAVWFFITFAKKWGWRSEDILRLITVALVAEIAGSPQPLKPGQLVNFISDPNKVALFEKLRRELLDLPESTTPVAEPDEDDMQPYDEFGHEDEAKDFQHEEGPLGGATR
jgi:hypothetical protein